MEDNPSAAEEGIDLAYQVDPSFIVVVGIPSAATEDNPFVEVAFPKDILRLA